jgi:hypothetical protein
VDPESGHLVGLLIEAGCLEDTRETFDLVRRQDWETREFAMSKSAELPIFLDSSLVKPSEVALFMGSQLLSNAAKEHVFSSFREYIEGSDPSGFEAIASYAVAGERALSTDDLHVLAHGGAKAASIVRLLCFRLEDRDVAEVHTVLQQLGANYRELASPSGLKPRFPDDPDHQALLRYLQEFGYVASHDVYVWNRDERVANMRRA